MYVQRRPRRVTCLNRENSARSQLAEAFLRHHHQEPERFEI